LESVRSLDRADVAHIVIDGASTDGTVEFLSSRDCGDVEWISEPDKGIYEAMNKGWARAYNSSYVLFLGAGDRLLSLPGPSNLAELQRRKVDLVYGDADLGYAVFPSRFSDDLRFGNALHHQALLVLKAAHPTPPFNARYRVYGDWDFNLRLWKAGVRAEYSPQLKSFAEPGGVSESRPIIETFQIAFAHAGVSAALRACSRMLIANALALLKRWRLNA
jgi:glycosyltransferase involved in cell wall biosynthesis